MKIKDIKNWFEIAIPEPTVEQACVQIGCHYEEVGEMAKAVGDYDAELEIANTSLDYKGCNAHYLESVELLTDEQKIELLDSLADQIVTAIGVAHMLGMDIEGALEEVNRSNHSKFEDGKPVFNEQGKIAKGKNYTAPQLAKFIGK
jgi:predicted HAD superfamily Cof-like phosphohydrolase